MIERPGVRLNSEGEGKIPGRVRVSEEVRAEVDRSDATHRCRRQPRSRAATPFSAFEWKDGKIQIKPKMA